MKRKIFHGKFLEKQEHDLVRPPAHYCLLRAKVIRCRFTFILNNIPLSVCAATYKNHKKILENSQG